MLEVKGLNKSFGGFKATTDVSFTVERQQIAAVIGPNGAGKSTLFNLITGHIAPDSGIVRFAGKDIVGMAPYAICRLGMGRSFQHANIFPRLTVFENLQAAFIAHRGASRNLWRNAKSIYEAETIQLMRSLGMQEQAVRTAGTLSHGNQKQLELGIALAADPKMLLLDEPTAGMSSTETRATIELLQRIATQRELTLLFTEHDMDVVFAIAQKIAVLHQGRLIAVGTPAEVRANADVRRIYLGSRHDEGGAARSDGSVGATAGGTV
ncbi:MAG: ABC transporter ATP-binding protein [Burkholderiaceae bacterium]